MTVSKEQLESNLAVDKVIREIRKQIESSITTEMRLTLKNIKKLHSALNLIEDIHGAELTSIEEFLK